MKYTEKQKYAMKILNTIANHEVETEIKVHGQLNKLNTFTLKLIYENLKNPY